MAAQRMQSHFPGKCSECSAEYSAGQWIYYDKEGPRGKKAFCIDCGFNRRAPMLAPSPVTQAHESQVMPEVEPIAPTAAPVTDLAAIIAAAVAPMVKGQLDEARVVVLIKQHAKPMARTITVVTPDGVSSRDMGRQHKQFETLLKVCSAKTYMGRLNVWLAGAAGTGKTTAAENVALALGLECACTGSLLESYKLFGHISPGTGNYVSTPFRKMWECGGMFIFDDFDGSDPAMAVELNNALANGTCTFPDGVVRRHPDCLLVLTANTWGIGGTTEYVGRMKQDAAFLDRFVKISWEIDEQLELDTCPDTKWAERVQYVRRNVTTKGIRVLVTPRASYYGAALLQAGLTQPEVEAMVLKGAMSDEQWRSIQ